MDSSIATITGDIPTRKANISLRLGLNYSEYQNPNSVKTQNLISILQHELFIFCKKADAQNFKNVSINRLIQGSVIAESTAEYNYPNNNTQIQFLNNNLGQTLERILNDSESFQNLSAALNASIEVTRITMGKVEILNISQVKPFVNCPVNLENLTQELDNGVWVCVGPCKANPDFCNHHGECQNAINGAVCNCTSSYFEKYYGDQCEQYSRGPGFYAVLFGSLAALALLIIITVVMVVVFHRARSRSFNIRRLSIFDDDFFDFTSRGHTDRGYWHQNILATEDSDSGTFRPYPENTSAR